METGPERKEDKGPPPVTPHIGMAIIGEKSTQDMCRILKNDRAVAILNAMLKGARTASEMSTTTGSSIQVVSYYLRAMLSVGLVEIRSVIKGRRGKDVKIYELTKPVLLLIPKPVVEASRIDLKRLREMLSTVMVASVTVLLLMTFPLLAVTHSVRVGEEAFGTTVAYSQMESPDQYSIGSLPMPTPEQVPILTLSMVGLVVVVLCLGRGMTARLRRSDTMSIA